jgi:hypothetical protein
MLGENWSAAEEFSNVIDMVAYSAIAVFVMFLVGRAIFEKVNSAKK